MKKLNNKGFTAVEGLLILVLAALIVGVGWYVANQRSENAQKTETPVTTQKEAKRVANCGTGIAKDWTILTSRQNSYSLCIPDGWTVYNNANESVDSTNPYNYSPGKKAVILNQNAAGSDGVRDIFYIQKTEKFYLGWIEKGTKSEFKLNDGTVGTRYYQKYENLSAADKEGLGAPVEGEEAYEYQIKSKSGVLYQVTYVNLPPHKNIIDVVEAAIKTLNIK